MFLYFVKLRMFLVFNFMCICITCLGILFNVCFCMFLIFFRHTKFLQFGDAPSLESSMPCRHSKGALISRKALPAGPTLVQNGDFNHLPSFYLYNIAMV